MFLVLAIALAATAARAELPKVCFDPARPCPGFKANDISFPLDRTPGARGEQRSAPFYAVMLKLGKHCAVTRAEAQEIQALFPRRKVFYNRFECDGDVENNVSYSNIHPTVGFIAVYAGETKNASREFYAEVNAMKRFRGVILSEKQVIYNSP